MAEPFSSEQLIVEGGGIYFGDLSEVQQKCTRLGFSFTARDGEHIVFHKPALCLCVHSDVDPAHVEQFLRAMFSTEDGYIDGPASLDGTVLRLERLWVGHSISAPREDAIWDGYYVLADKVLDPARLPSEKELQKLTEGPLLFGDGHGVAVAAGSEYKYMVRATEGSDALIVMSTGYEMVDEADHLVAAWRDAYEALRSTK
eukprot:TRINITY_DN768_c0_g1_i1.p1 TRINITY_DN768_c0_g1~~TRINITY_DN768_c0_g1_i1.p1  ORF type:complete len:227 (+),score=92.63 TRINITY_DN768_c0_g1_i1:79-681(+)